MRLLATFAAVATVNAFIDDNQILQRTRRDDDAEVGCEDGTFPTVGGFCTDTKELAQDLANHVMEAESGVQGRKFPMDSFAGAAAGAGDRSPFFDGDSPIERTKRRSQRMTLLIAKVISGGTVVDQESGEKMKSKEFIKRVNNYGCHCWARTKHEHLSGKGKPLDELDGTCHSLRQCHKCINIEYDEAEGAHEDGCDPVTTKYKAKLARLKDGSLEISCTNTMNKKGTNNGDCKRSLCECDKQFAEDFAKQFAAWDESLWNLEEQGKYEEMCESSMRSAGVDRLMSGSGPDQCCGLYPFKKPFNSATHSCVDGQVTNDNNV